MNIEFVGNKVTIRNDKGPIDWLEVIKALHKKGAVLVKIPDEKLNKVTLTFKYIEQHLPHKIPQKIRR